MRREDGFTIIEVLAAAIILMVGIASTFTVFDSSRRLSLVSERQTTLAQRAQNELERVLSLPWSQVALTGTSAQWSSDPSSYTYVSNPAGGCPGTAGGTPPSYQPDHSHGGSTATEQLVIDGCTYSYTVNGTPQTLAPKQGTVAPVQSWSAQLQNGATVSGSVYDFITWTADPTCSQTSTPGSSCSTTDDYKRVTVVVTENGATQPSNPAIVSGFVTPPNSGPGPVNPGAGTKCTNSQGQTVSCTNTPPPGNVTPEPIFPGCSPNSQTNTAPDGSTTTPPTTDCPSSSLPCASNCNNPSNNPGSSTPCVSPPSGAPAWVSPAIPAGTTWTLTGNGQLTAYLQGNNGQAVSGQLCLGIYVYPQGPLAALLGGTVQLGNLVGTPVQQSFTVPANTPPLPVTFDFNLGSGSYAIASTGLAEIEYVLWVQTTTGPVNFFYGQPSLASELTMVVQTS